MAEQWDNPVGGKFNQARLGGQGGRLQAPWLMTIVAVVATAAI